MDRKLLAILKILVIFLCCISSFNVFADECTDVFPDAENPDTSFELDVPSWSSTTNLIETGGSDTFAPGDHYFNSGQLSGGYSLESGGVTARLYFKSLTVSGNTELNSGGNPEDLIIVVDGPVTISGRPEINAIIYATSVAILSGNFDFTGSITAEGSITINGGSDVNYDSDAVDNADFGTLCDSSSGGSSIGIPISDNDDDVEERISDGDMYFNSSDLEMSHDSFRGGVQEIGLLFRGVNIPPGSTITNAYVEFTADGNHSGATNLVIRGEGDATPDDFSNSDFDVSNRTKTTASVSWSPESWSDDEFYATDDITAIIQEIIDLAGWSSGNNLVITIEPGSGCTNSSCRRRAESHNGDSDNAPRLVVEFDAPALTASLEFRMDEQSWSGSDGDVLDSSSNASNGSSKNGVNTTSDGHLCYAGRFDGVDDYIESDEVYDLLKGTASLSVWVKTSQVGDNTGWRAPGISGVEQAGGSDDIFWGWLDASGRIGISVANDFSTKSTVSINDNVFHHVVLTRDATAGTYQIYIDGVLDNSGSIATGIIGNSFSGIGVIEDTGGSPEFFEGTLDELKIYNAVLTADQVTEIYNETRDCPIYSCQDKNYLDRFNTQSFSNSDGTTNWSDAWIEIDESNGPNGGSVRISGGELQLRGSGGENGIYRVVDLTDIGSAELSFDYRDSGLENSDELELSIYDGSSWTLLDVFDRNSSHTRYTYDISDYTNADSRIRFIEKGNQGNDRFYIDDLEIDGECQAGIDHLEISYSGTPTTCAPLAITVRACQDDNVPCNTLVDDYAESVSLSVSTGRGDWSNGIGNFGTLTDPSANDGSEVYEFNADDNGDATFTLDYTFADGVVLTAEDSENNLVATVDVVFSDNGLILEWTDSLSPTGALPSVGVAGRSHQLTASFIKQDPVTGECGVVEEYTGDKPLIAWWTDNGDYSVTTNAPVLDDQGANPSLTLPAAAPAASNITVDFSEGVAVLNAITSDVGKFAISLRDIETLDDISGDPIAITGSTPLVTFRPFGFSVDVHDENSSASCNTSGYRENTSTGFSYAEDSDGDKYLSAGSSFDLVARAVLWDSSDDPNDDGVPNDYSTLYDNSCAPSFGKESSAESVTVSLDNFRPSGGSDGSLSASTIAVFDGGAATATTSYSEVGIVDLSASLTSGDYLSSGQSVSGELDDLGRFYPHYFEVSANTPLFNDELGWSCGFTYQDQTFDFATAIELTLTAKNADGINTTKYYDDYYKLDAPDASSAGFTNAASAAISTVSDRSVSAEAVIAGNDVADAESTVIFEDYLLAYLKAAEKPDAVADQPFDASVDWDLPAAELTDADDVCVYPDKDATACVSIVIQNITGTELRYGRVSIGNNNGSELLPLELPVQIQYWNQTSSGTAFMVNDLDDCSYLAWTDSGADPDLTLAGYKGNLQSGETSASLESFSAGEGVVLLTAPGDGNDGTVNASIRVADWLKYPFRSINLEDPVGTATFGIYAGRAPVFYLRESYR
jgi:hypothetical protein